MLTDSRILAHFLDKAIRTFAEPRNRRELAAELRRIRNTSGRKTAALVLAQLSAANLSAPRRMA